MRKFNYFFTIVAMSFAAMMSLAVVSCGDDEKEEINSGGNQYGGGDSKDSTNVNPSNSYFRDPIITWGASMQQVKSYMSDYEVIYEGSDYIAYNGKGIESAYYYIFDDSKLCMSGVDIPLNSINKNALQSRLTTAGYTLVESSDTTDFYISNDQKTLVLLSNSSYYEVYELQYVDYEWMFGGGDDEPSEPIDYFAPYTVWGASKSQVKNYMSNYELYREYEDYLIYEGDDQAEAYYYAFNGSELCYSEVDIDIDNASKGSIIAKLENEGFEILGEQDTTVYMISADEKTYIELNTSNYYEVYEIYYISTEWLDQEEDDEDVPSNPVSSSFFAPTTNWGASKSQVKNYMNGYQLYNEETNGLIYLGSGNAYSYFYGFENNKLYFSEVDLRPDSINLDAIANQLIENGYEYAEKQDTIYFFNSTDMKSVVMVYVSQYYYDYEVVYFDYAWIQSQYGSEVKSESPASVMRKAKAIRSSFGNSKSDIKNLRLFNKVSSLLSTKSRNKVRVSKYARLNNTIAAKRDNAVIRLRKQ